MKSPITKMEGGAFKANPRPLQISQRNHDAQPSFWRLKRTKRCPALVLSRTARWRLPVQLTLERHTASFCRYGCRYQAESSTSFCNSRIDSPRENNWLLFLELNAIEQSRN